MGGDDESELGESGETSDRDPDGRRMGSFTLGTPSISEVSMKPGKRQWGGCRWSLTGEELPEEQVAMPKGEGEAVRRAVDDWVFNGESSSESGVHFQRHAEESQTMQSEVENAEEQAKGEKMKILYIQMQLCEPTTMFDWVQTPNRKVLPGTESHRE